MRRHLEGVGVQPGYWSMHLQAGCIPSRGQTAAHVGAACRCCPSLLSAAAACRCCCMVTGLTEFASLVQWDVSILIHPTIFRVFVCVRRLLQGVGVQPGHWSLRHRSQQVSAKPQLQHPLDTCSCWVYLVLSCSIMLDHARSSSLNSTTSLRDSRTCPMPVS